MYLCSGMGSRKPKYSHAKIHPPKTLLNPRKCICPNYKIYLSKLQNIFVQIAKCICLNCKI